MKISKRCLVNILLAVAAIAVIGGFAWYSAYLSTRDLEIQAARAIVAWVFEDQLIPGFEEVISDLGGERKYIGGYAGSSSMHKADHWYVICDFLPQGVSLSDNPRIERISYEEAMAIHHQAISTREGSFLFINFYLDSSRRPASRSGHEIKLSILTVYAAEGGDMYDFTFTKIDGQLNATGRHAGGS